MQLIVIFTRAAWGPAHNNGCGPLPEKVAILYLHEYKSALYKRAPLHSL